MSEKTLSIFVDESGNFGYPDKVSHYYVIGLVLHDQDISIQSAVADLDLALRDMHISHHCFHAGPMIRREKGYEFMDAGFRRRIFAAMMAFARKVDFRYFCLSIDKRFVTSREQIIQGLENQMRDFLVRHTDAFGDFSKLKVYYDCGQSEVTRILHETIESVAKGRVAFAQGVDPAKYKLFQVADLICTIRLLELKLQNGEVLTESEQRFFGGPRDFKRNILKKLGNKKLQ